MYKAKFCSPGEKNEMKRTCFSLDQLKKIGKDYNQHKSNGGGDIIDVNQNKYALWENIRRKLSDVCDHEWCWIDQHFVENSESLEDVFRPKRPMGKYQWLTTSNIHDVMKQYEKAHQDFVFFGPVPIDFAQIMPHVGKLDISGMYASGTRRIGLVFNTDPSTKGGKHWISMFIDLNERSIEFFDSFGICPGPPEVMNLIKHVQSYQSQFGKFNVRCSNIRHQYSNSECGVYSMYFITERLSGKTFDQIGEKIIKDSMINGMRNYYFRPSE